MARKTIIVYTDDIDGSEGARRVAFTFDGRAYEIDLSEENAGRFAAAVEPFIEKATRVGGPRRTRKGDGAVSESAKIRVWARSRGIAVPDRGRVPNDIVEQYNAEN